MRATRQTACERCGRLVDPAYGCPQHRGAPLLDLRRADDRSWRAEVLAMQRHRYVRLATAVAGTLGMVWGLSALTELVQTSPLTHTTEQSGITWLLSHVLHFLSVGLVLGGFFWGTAGIARFGRARAMEKDPIDRQAAGRELARRATAVATATIFAVSAVGLRLYLVGVPAELAAAAVSLVCTPPILGFLETMLVQTTTSPSEDDLLPPVSDGVLQDARTADPLERARRSAFRMGVMNRR